MKKVKQKVAAITYKNKSQYCDDLKTIPSNTLEEGKEFINSEGKEFDALLFTEDGKIETASTSKLKDGRLIILREPTLSILYFSLAHDILPQLKDDLDEYFTLFNYQNIYKTNQEDSMKVLVKLFSNVSAFSFFLFASLEAFINEKIPSSTTHIEKSKNIKLGYSEILRKMSFNNKYEKVFKKVTTRNFSGDKTKDWDKIKTLKSLRDNLVHIKPEVGSLKSHSELFDTIINFDFNGVFGAVENFLNYHEDSYIIYE